MVMTPSTPPAAPLLFLEFAWPMLAWPWFPMPTPVLWWRLFEMANPIQKNAEGKEYE
jgi:hypothetical protein